MAKFHGKIGYVELLETSPGVWTENITEKEYCGDLIRNSRRYDRSEQLNDNLKHTGLTKISQPCMFT